MLSSLSFRRITFCNHRFKFFPLLIVLSYLISMQTGCVSLATMVDENLVKPYKKAPYLGAIPNRPDNAMTGSQFIRYSKRLSKASREKAILTELRRGNIPDFLRNLEPVTFQIKRRGKVVRSGKIFVMPDYLAIGSNDDFIRIPMNPITAQKIADHYGFVLPTKKMVDRIYQSAEIKLKPSYLSPGPAMVSSRYYERHNYIINQTLGDRAFEGLIAGHKKDVVVTNKLEKKRRRVAIYGWHRPNGRPVQPLSTIHNDFYADYSHGVRLVAGTMLYNGREIPVVEVLQDRNKAWLLNDEGSLIHTRQRTWKVTTR